jgi:hypothetical protein
MALHVWIRQNRSVEIGETPMNQRGQKALGALRSRIAIVNVLFPNASLNAAGE